MKQASSHYPDPDPRLTENRVEVRTGRVSACGRRCVEEKRASPLAKRVGGKNLPKERKITPKSIILYNLKEGVSDEDYRKWCEECKGPFFLSLGACESFTLVWMLGGMKGDGSKSLPPEATPPPYKYIGILEVSSLEEWQKDTESAAFKEGFFSPWFSKWVAEFYVLVGMEVYRVQPRTLFETTASPLTRKLQLPLAHV